MVSSILAISTHSERRVMEKPSGRISLGWFWFHFQLQGEMKWITQWLASISAHRLWAHGWLLLWFWGCGFLCVLGWDRGQVSSSEHQTKGRVLHHFGARPHLHLRSQSGYQIYFCGFFSSEGYDGASIKALSHGDISADSCSAGLRGVQGWGRCVQTALWKSACRRAWTHTRINDNQLRDGEGKHHEESPELSVSQLHCRPLHD